MRCSGHENIFVNKQYGKWNAILAFDEQNSYVFYQNHSKIFPEPLEDWVDALKRTSVDHIFSPVRLDIDITNHCSNNCVMCFSRELKEKIKSMIPLSHLIKILDNFKQLGGKSVRLTGGGDPLNHPKIIEIIEYLSTLNFKITIETNGDLLSSQISDAVARHVHHLRISVDAADNISRERVHQPCHSEFTYDSLIQKIKAVQACALKYNRHKELFLGATFVIMPENFRLVGKFLGDMYNLGINWVAIRQNIYREVYEKHPDIIPFVENELKIFRQKIEKSDKDFTIEEQYGVSFNPKNDFESCLVSYIRPIVLANASLQLCCLARNGIIPEADIGILPNTSQPFEQLMNSKKDLIKHFRESVPQQCQFCIDKDNNMSFSYILRLLKMNRDFKFFKAHVYLNADEKIFLDENQIIQVPVNGANYREFIEGSIIAIHKQKEIKLREKVAEASSS